MDKFNTFDEISTEARYKVIWCIKTMSVKKIFPKQLLKDVNVHI